MATNERDTEHMTHVNIDGESTKMTADQLRAFRELSFRQRKLVLATLAGDISPRDAAASAGYTYAAVLRIMNDSEHPVVKLVDAFNRERITDAIMGRDEILARLTDMGRVEMDDVVEWHNEGQAYDMDTGEIFDKQTVFTVKAAHQMTAAARGSIKRIRQTRYGLDVELHDGRSAIVDLARIQGIDAAKKIDHTSSDRTMSPKDVTRDVVTTLVDKLVD